MKSDTEADTAATDSDGIWVSKVNSMKKFVRKASQPDADAGSFAFWWRATTAKIWPGSALIVRHLLNSGSKDVDALYYVHDRRFQEDGVLCECTFVGASGKAHSDFQNIKKGTDHVLHLCSSTNGCPSLRNRSSIVHALVWKPLAFSKLIDPWIT